MGRERVEGRGLLGGSVGEDEGIVEGSEAFAVELKSSFISEIEELCIGSRSIKAFAAHENLVRQL